MGRSVWGLALSLLLQLGSPLRGDAYAFALIRTGRVRVGPPLSRCPRETTIGARPKELHKSGVFRALPTPAGLASLQQNVQRTCADAASVLSARVRQVRITSLKAVSGLGGNDMGREAVDLELQNAIQLNDLLVIQDMVQVSCEPHADRLWECLRHVCVYVCISVHRATTTTCRKGWLDPWP